ncbi:MAG TPA: L,D-transpeptidase family protein, partial [Acidimicrobiia bacterium]|nr:L,D-transpeptidase family protein [Acidimicrobiia bacterium]
LAARAYIAQLAPAYDGKGYRLLARTTLADVVGLNPGDTGAAVQYLQNRLRGLGFWVPGATGVYDSVTQQAVYAFQKYYGLPRTGSVDAATRLQFRVATPPVPRSKSGDLIEIDKTRQIMMIVRSGAAVWTFAISSGSDQTFYEQGSPGPHIAHTPEGVFTIIRQVDGYDKSPLGVLYRPKYFTWEGHAVHGYTEVPPYPASHGCVRVSNTAMDWLWANNMLPIGMPVWVY